MFAVGFKYEPFMDAATWWVRFDGNPIFRADPVLFWRLRPFANDDLDPKSRDTQATNSMGFRNEEFDRKKQPGEFRVITMGDSCTFGDGVANWEAYGPVLEKRLSKAMPDRKVTVINAGVPGYTTYQVLAYLKNELLDLKPDVVTLYVGLNDNIPATKAIPDSHRSPKSQTLYTTFYFLHNLRSVQMMEFLVYKYIKPIRTKVISTDPDHHPFRVPFDEYMDNLCKIKKLGDENGFLTIVMTLPHKFTNESERNAKIRSASEKCNIPLLDLWYAMKDFQNRGDQLYCADGGHPNQLGQAAIAYEIHRKLAEMKVVSPPVEPFVDKPAPTIEQGGC